MADKFPSPENVLRIPTLVLNPPPSLADLWASRISDQVDVEEPAITKMMETLFSTHLRGKKEKPPK